MNLSESSYATMAKRFLYAAYLGLNNYVEIKLNNGDTAEGIFKGIESESNAILIKNFVNISKDSRQVDGSKLLSFADVKYMAVKELDPKAYLSKPLKEKPFVRHNFEIDTQVGGQARKKPGKVKSMVKWTPGDDGPAGLGDLELDKSQTGRDKFDQFQANEDMFGISTEFDEASYTTQLKISEFSEEQIRKAARLADEIEKDDLKDDLNNRHMLEERGRIELKDNDDEEALYSAVVRNDPVQPAQDLFAASEKQQVPGKTQREASNTAPAVQVAPAVERLPLKLDSKSRTDFKLKTVKQNDMVKLQNTFKHFCYDNWKKMVEGDKKHLPVKKVEDEVKTRKITNSQPFQVTPPAPAAPRYQQNNQYYPQNNYMMQGQPMMGYGDGRFDYGQQSHQQQSVDYNNMMMMYPPNMNMGMNGMVMNPMMMQYPFNMLQNPMQPMQPMQYSSLAGLPPGTTVGTINLQPQPDGSHHAGDKR